MMKNRKKVQAMVEFEKWNKQSLPKQGFYLQSFCVNFTFSYFWGMILSYLELFCGWLNISIIAFQLYVGKHSTDNHWRHKSKISEKLGRCGRQNMLQLYLKIWECDWILGRAVKAISSLGVRSPWSQQLQAVCHCPQPKLPVV